MLRSSIVTVAVMSAACGSPAAGPVVYAAVVESGLFTDAMPDDDSPEADLDLDRVRSGRQIPCALGEHFGVAFHARVAPKGSQEVELLAIWDHPPFEGPAGSTKHESRASVKFSNGVAPVAFQLWRFDSREEMVEGTWKLELFHAGRSLFTREYEVRGCR